MGEQEKHIEALIKLHQGLERLGPGDNALSNFILTLLPEMPEDPHIVDVGCGTGAGTFLLAKHFEKPVLAQDFSKPFLDELLSRAESQGIGHLVSTEQSDMGNLSWDPGSIDLLWSEGAAYNLGFEQALTAWRPMMKDNGIAVISELSYFSDDIPDPLKSYWENAYPGVGSESENLRRAERGGFEILGFHRLRSEAWWDNYYSPLKERMHAFANSQDEAMLAVLADARKEMELFESFSDIYGYTFYILQAI